MSTFTMHYSNTPSLHVNGINQAPQKDLQFQCVVEILKR